MRFVHPNSLCRARLAQRRRIVVRTLDYIDAEQNALRTKTGKDPLARKGRKRLLDAVYGWYDTELKKIDTTLDRMKRSPERSEITDDVR